MASRWYDFIGSDSTEVNGGCLEGYDDVAAGRLGFAWQSLGGKPSLVLGGRAPGGGPDFYFVFPAQTVEDALAFVEASWTYAAFVLPLARLISTGYGVPGIKAALLATGVDAGWPRPPLAQAPESAVATIRAALHSLEDAFA